MAAVDTVVADTLRWLERAVVGLNLCPFAKAVLVKRQLHVAVCASPDSADMLAAFEQELDALVAADPLVRETTLLVLPSGLDEFLSFHAFSALAERIVRKRGLDGVIQVASFHPGFVFAGTDEDDITNFTNRSPYPTLHLLREDSIERAVAAIPDAAAIYETNMGTMRRLGRDGWRALDVEATE
jgi:hypothetical protein